MTATTKTAEEILEDLADELEIPPSRYEAAERSYKSLGSWLERTESSLANVALNVYAQGSFQLGTVNKPSTPAEDYDLDVVCEFDLSKTHFSQHELKELLGKEIKSYAEAKQMEAPHPGRRCWTLNYSDGAQFHMDVLPSLPDGKRQRLLLERAGHGVEWAHLAIAITCTDHPMYRVRCEDWPGSNPKGYAAWFKFRMSEVFERRRRAIALMEAKANVEDIPTYRVKTPLQSAIRILKRHRDVRFADDPDNRPISIILTTLAARSYNQETTISGALFAILRGMDQHIEDRHGVSWVPNPSDPRENFADRWVEFPQRKQAFHDWLAMARADFEAAAAATDPSKILDTLSPRMGRQLMESAVRKRHRIPSTVIGSISSGFRRVMEASHKKPLQWRELAQGVVVISSAKFIKPGWRPQPFTSDGPSLPKLADLTFEAATNVPAPYRVYWQVVNTGDEARLANGLRGGFFEGSVDRGKLTRHESTKYQGPHSIECFIVKDGLCAARSGPFLVNIG